MAGRSRERKQPKLSDNFLRDANCPRQVRELAREPLLLYLLGAMHRDGQIHAGMFAETEAGEAKVLIYEAALEWVLEKQRSEGCGSERENINPQIVGLDPEDLQSLLAEAALCVVQSGCEKAKVSFIEDRLVERGDGAAKEIIETARRSQATTQTATALKNALAAFYLKAGADNAVEFFHKSFGEFLFAVRLCEGLQAWTEKTGKRRKTYSIRDREFEWQVYDLLGFGNLTVEVVEHLRVLLKRDDTDWEALYERLYDFYIRWSDGEFIEALEATDEMLPLKKARQLQKYSIRRGQRQVDAATGLNVFILLLEIHRYARATENLKEKINFYVCGGEKRDPDFTSLRLFRIVGYCEFLAKGYFVRLIGIFFMEANLTRAYLKGVNLSFANLSKANLRRANLISADLRNAKLTSANLSEAELFNALFEDADLRNADLSNASLLDTSFRGADLKGANFSGAYLIGTTLDDANLDNITWDDRTIWQEVRGLKSAKNVPAALESLVSYRETSPQNSE